MKSLVAPLLAFLLAAPVPCRAQAEDAVRERVLAGMSAERRARLSGVRVVAVGRGEPLVDAAVRVTRAVFPAEDAARVERGLREDYAKWSALAASDPEPRVSAPMRGLTQYFEGGALCFVGEENLSAAGWDENGSRAGRIGVHELGHAVEDLGLSDAERAELDRIWVDNLRRRGLSESDAAAGQKTEFFAESTEAWFDVHQHAPGEAGHGPSFFRTRFPVMGAFLERVYGPPR